jgi:hypothetical protein
MWTQFGSSSTQYYKEGYCWPGINNATSASIWTAYSGDEGATWSTPVDITAQVKTGVMANATECNAGPGNCAIWLQNGKLFTTLWYATAGTVSATVSSVNNGSTTVTATGSTAAFDTGSIFANITISTDSSKNVYAVTAVSGSTLTITPAFSGTSVTSGTIHAVGNYANVGTYWQGGCVAFTTGDLTGATGWTIGGSIPGAFAGMSGPSECQAVQLPSGLIVAVQRFSATSPPNTSQFATCSDGVGTTWTAATPASFPIPTPTCTIGLLNYGGALIFSGPNSTAAGNAGRVDLTLAYSRDDAVTWSNIALPSYSVPSGSLVNDGGTMYSALAILPGGDIAVHSMFGPGGGANNCLYIIPPNWLGLPVPTPAAMMGF